MSESEISIEKRRLLVVEKMLEKEQITKIELELMEKFLSRQLLKGNSEAQKMHVMSRTQIGQHAEMIKFLEEEIQTISLAMIL